MALDTDGPISPVTSAELKLVCRERSLPLERVAVMGVLNVTPDSFSDGGLWTEPAAAVAHAEEMHAAGAAIIDVGGESTRPGADHVPEAEELRRVLPIVEGIAAACDALISIDTRKASVARRAVEAGAHIINDTLGEASDGSIDEVAYETGAAIIVMHSRGTPATMRQLTEYTEIVGDVRSFLEARALGLEATGIPRSSIALDPGIGFAKTPAQNLSLLRRLGDLSSLQWPLLVGTSRKSFIGAVLDLPEEERSEGTLTTVVASVIGGARIVRVHEVEPTVRAVRMIEAVMGAD